MSTLSQLVAARDAAGDRYVAAVAELKAAWVDLVAIERTLCNGNVGHALSFSSFGDRPDVLSLRHGTYLPQLQDDWLDAVSAATNAKLAAYPTPDE